MSNNRSDLAAVLAQVRSGRLGKPDDWDYYGAKLPEALCRLSVNCKVGQLTSTAGAARALFLPAWIGAPDDAVGWAHFDGSPPHDVDAFGGRDCPTVDGGDGWWWLSQC